MPRTHKSLPRLYVDLPLGVGAKVPLGRDQTNYLIGVLRLTTGDSVILFNGRDGAWLARIGEATRKQATLETVLRTADQTPPPDIWYGFAPLKAGARLDYVVQKATEMGVGVIQPVITRFTQVRRLKRDRLVANVIEAAEQCEVLSVPEVADEIALDALVAGWRQTHGLRRLIVADEAAPSATPEHELRRLEGLPVGLLIGPEGGFAEDERDLLLSQDFVVPISLGPRILRADTAAVAALALIQATIGDWR